MRKGNPIKVPTQEELDKEVELSYLESRLKKLSDDELVALITKVVRDKPAVKILDGVADTFGYTLE